MGKGIGFGMISCVERTSLHFCSDAAAARVANTPMQPSGASHRLCEAYCQRLAGRSFLDAHAAFHDVFFRSEPSARCGRSGRVVGASRRPVRSWDAPRRLSCPAEACSRWPTRWCGPFILGIYARQHARCCLGWSGGGDNERTNLAIDWSKTCGIYNHTAEAIACGASPCAGR